MKMNILWTVVYIMLTFALFACGAGNNTPGASSSSKAITAYSFSNPSAIGNINENDKTISITVPYGTDIAGLIATLTSTGASVKVDGTVQVSGITANDFTNPVIYTVTAADGSTTLYTVTVTVALNSAKSLMSFTILGISGTIDEFAKTITLSVPHGTNIIGLVASFTTTGASVKVDGTVQVSGITANDFTNPVIYTVTAADSSTTHYTVTVIARPLPECTWVQRYSKTPTDVEWDQPTAIAVDAAGNVYVTGGGTDVTAGQPYGYATIKYDSNGNQLWLHRYDAWDWAKSIALDSSGNVYITGQPATIKYNSTGAPVWIKNYGYNDIRGISVKIDNSDNIYVTGWKMNSENKNDAVTIKYDADGKVLWERTHHESGRYLLFKSLVIDSWGNVYAAGLSDAAGGTDYKYIVVKYGSAGEELWTRHVDGVTAFATSERISLAVDLQGAVYLGGGIVEPDLDVYSSDFGLIKYDKDGNQLWMSRYDGPGNYIDYANGIVLDSQGNIIVTGFSWGTNTDWDYTTMKYDTSGNQLWVRRFDSGRDSAKAITIDQMDSVYVTGGIWGPLGFATIKYDTNGNQSWIAYYGGPADLQGWATAIVLDISGNVYVTGYSKGASTNYDFATIKYTQ